VSHTKTFECDVCAWPETSALVADWAMDTAGGVFH
jgi:hypothetical protein